MHKLLINRAASLVLGASLICGSSYGEAKDGYAALVHKVSPSVVTVLVEEEREGAGHRALERATANIDGIATLMRRLLTEPSSGSEPSDHDFVLGSGFIIDPQGIIVTNRHVIIGARTVHVKLADGRQIEAQVIGSDAPTDIALLRVNAGRLPALRLGSSNGVSVGDPVIAIGNPFGLGQTVTAGILSARGRNLEADPYIDFLQTDAAINHGNSGGPLLNASGVVVGVTSAILSPSGGSVGLGFAIPAETVTSIIGELETHGRVDRGYLGISAQAMTPALSTALGNRDPEGGALITAVEPNAPTLGVLLVGDVLLRINTTPVTFPGLGKILARLKPGVSADVTFLRDGAEMSTTVLIGQLPDPPVDPARSGDSDTWVRGLALAVANTTAAIRMALKSEESNGLIVTQLRPTGAGSLARLRIGDLITHAGTRRLMDVRDLENVAAPTAASPLLLRVVRDGAPSFVAVTGVDEP